MNKIRFGAPKGGRVHWLLYSLPSDFLKVYDIDYNYKYHNYRFVRYAQNRVRYVIDEFIVIRTSKRCWRVSYFNRVTADFKYFNADTYSACSAKIYEVYYENRDVKPKGIAV
jgi:hypothetical protein